MQQDKNRQGGQQNQENQVEQNQNQTLNDPGAAVADYGRSGNLKGEGQEENTGNRQQEGRGNGEGNTLGNP